MRVQRRSVVSPAAVLAMAVPAAADITIPTNTVGDVGNAADTSGFGAVGYQYSIGRSEVTNAQYAAFLNAKAATDTYGLYSTNMAGSAGGITRSGSSGSYAYSTIAGRENWAVNWVNFWDAARFANWLQNGQGSGDTETGTYTLGGAYYPTNSSVSRNPGSTWAIAGENEWYKAAYYKGGGLSAGYWLYPTQGDSITTAMANYGNSVGTVTPAGSYPFTSAYGAVDMGGNVAEWNEAIVLGSFRGVRGGSFSGISNSLRSESRSSVFPESETATGGFRVVQIPGPGPLAALALGGMLARGRRRGAGRRW